MNDPDYLNNEAKPEYVICAAIWFQDAKKYSHQPNNVESGFVICGRRHHNCFTTAFILQDGEQITEKYSERKRNAEQGFMTSKNRFVSREEAAEIAFDQKQIAEQPKILFSEHLY